MLRALLPAVLLLAACVPAPADGPLEVTYVANTGFIIRSGDDKVLVDALFNDDTISYAHVPDGVILKDMAAAEPPFDGVDLVLVTHRHRDHFEAGLMTAFLESSEDTVLVAPPQAADQLPESDQVRSVLPELHHFEDVEVGDVRVRAYLLNHSAYMETDPVTGEERNRHAGVQNLVYVVEIGGRRFLHSGDAVLSQSLDLFEDDRFRKVDLDLAFLEYFDWSEETAGVLEEWMTPDHIVFMHLPPQPDKIEQLDGHLKGKFHQAVLFREPMEVRTF